MFALRSQSLTKAALLARLAGWRFMYRGWIGKRIGIVFLWREPAPKPSDRKRRKRS